MAHSKSAMKVRAIRLPFRTHLANAREWTAGNQRHEADTSNTGKRSRRPNAPAATRRQSSRGDGERGGSERASARIAGFLTPVTHKARRTTLLDANPHADDEERRNPGLRLARRTAACDNHAGSAIQQNTTTSTLPCPIGTSAYKQMASAANNTSATAHAPGCTNARREEGNSIRAGQPRLL